MTVLRLFVTVAGVLLACLPASSGAAEPEKGRFHAFVVAVPMSSYTGGLPPRKDQTLQAEQGAVQVLEALRIYAKAAGYDDEYFKHELLTTADRTTLQNIVRKWRLMLSQVDSTNDTGAFYFHGHGRVVPDPKADHVLLASGANGEDEFDQISLSDHIIKPFERVRAARRLVFIDACRPATKAELISSLSGPAVPAQSQISDLATRQGVAQFLATTKGLAWIDPDRGYGVYTHQLIVALQSFAGSTPYRYADEMDNALQRQVSAAIGDLKDRLELEKLSQTPGVLISKGARYELLTQGDIQRLANDTNRRVEGLKSAFQASLRSDPKQALRMAEDLLKAESDSAQYLNFLGAARVQLRDYQGALVAFGKSIEAARGDDFRFRPAFNRISTYIALSLYPAALEELERFVKDRPAHLDAQMSHALVLLMLGRYPEANRKFGSLVDSTEMPEGRAFARIGMTLALWYQNQREPAARHFSAALCVSPGLRQMLLEGEPPRMGKYDFQPYWKLLSPALASGQLKGLLERTPTAGSCA